MFMPKLGKKQACDIVKIISIVSMVFFIMHSLRFVLIAFYYTTKDLEVKDGDNKVTYIETPFLCNVTFDVIIIPIILMLGLLFVNNSIPSDEEFNHARYWIALAFASIGSMSTLQIWAYIWCAYKQQQILPSALNPLIYIYIIIACYSMYSTFKQNILIFSLSLILIVFMLFIITTKLSFEVYAIETYETCKKETISQKK
jgi:hypothetical protein